MRKVIYISGVLAIILLALLLSVADDDLKEAVSKGNRQHEVAEYVKALEEYETGLAIAADNKMLNYNAAQTAYLLGEYEKAAEYYEKSEDTKEKFLNYGNIYFRAGDAVEDAEQKVQLYGQALQIYEAGIIKYPQEVPLKYNYELVKEKLAELLQESEQNGESQDGDDQQSDDGEQQEGDQGPQNDEGEDQDSEGEQEDGESEEQQDGESQQQEGNSQSNEEAAADEEAIQRILQMLESQEEQSLKNNQEVVGGKEGKNGW